MNTTDPAHAAVLPAVPQRLPDGAASPIGLGNDGLGLADLAALVETTTHRSDFRQILIEEAQAATPADHLGMQRPAQ